MVDGCAGASNPSLTTTTPAKHSQPLQNASNYERFGPVGFSAEIAERNVTRPSKPKHLFVLLRVTNGEFSRIGERSIIDSDGVADVRWREWMMMMIGGSNADFARRHVARLQARWRGAIHDAAAGVGKSFPFDDAKRQRGR